MGPQCRAESGHLCQTAGQKRSLRVVAKADPVARAGRDRNHVLQRPTEFNPGYILRSIDAKLRAVEDALQGDRPVVIGAGDDHGRWHAPGNLLRMAGARQYGHRPAAEGLFGRFAEPDMRDGV